MMRMCIIYCDCASIDHVKGDKFNNSASMADLDNFFAMKDKKKKKGKEKKFAKTTSSSMAKTLEVFLKDLVSVSP